jgi:hypothetical protein
MWSSWSLSLPVSLSPASTTTLLSQLSDYRSFHTIHLLFRFFSLDPRVDPYLLRPTNPSSLGAAQLTCGWSLPVLISSRFTPSCKVSSPRGFVDVSCSHRVTQDYVRTSSISECFTVYRFPYFNHQYMLVLLFWDFILTFPSEVERYWNGPLTLASVVFYLVRYGTLVGYIIEGIMARPVRPSLFHGKALFPDRIVRLSLQSPNGFFDGNNFSILVVSGHQNKIIGTTAITLCGRE